MKSKQLLSLLKRNRFISLPSRTFVKNLDSNHFMYMKSFTNVQNGRLYNHISRNFGIFIFLRQAGFSASNQPLSFADASWFPRLRKFHGNASGKKSVRRFFRAVPVH